MDHPVITIMQEVFLYLGGAATAGCLTVAILSTTGGSRDRFFATLGTFGVLLLGGLSVWGAIHMERIAPLSFGMFGCLISIWCTRMLKSESVSLPVILILSINMLLLLSMHYSPFLN